MTAPAPNASDQHILSLSFTELQLEPVIAAAHARNVRVTLAGDAKRFEQFAATAAKADGRIVVDLRNGDPDACLETLTAAQRETPFTGLFVPADPEVFLAARFAERTGVPWNSVSAVERITSKWETRQTLAAHGLRQPEHFLVTNTDDARAVVSGGGAWMIKPERGTASEGVSKVTAPAHVERAVANLRRFHPSGPFVIERCIAPMFEYSVEGVWFDHAPVVVGITAKRTTGAPHFVETGHTVPVTLPSDLDHEVRTVVTAGLLALGASHGQFHVEVFVKPEQLPGHRVTFGEGHVRAGGDRITQILELAGLNLDALAVDAIIGHRPERPPQPTGAAASRYLVFPPGTVVSVEGVDEAIAIPGVEHLSIDVGVGDVLEAVVGNGSRHGRFVVAGTDFEDILALADRVEQTIRVEVDPAAAPGLTPESHSVV